MLVLLRRRQRGEHGVYHLFGRIFQFLIRPNHISHLAHRPPFFHARQPWPATAASVRRSFSYAALAQFPEQHSRRQYAPQLPQLQNILFLMKGYKTCCCNSIAPGETSHTRRKAGANWKETQGKANRTPAQMKYDCVYNWLKHMYTPVHGISAANPLKRRLNASATPPGIYSHSHGFSPFCEIRSIKNDGRPVQSSRHFPCALRCFSASQGWGTYLSYFRAFPDSPQGTR